MIEFVNSQEIYFECTYIEEEAVLNIDKNVSLISSKSSSSHPEDYYSASCNGKTNQMLVVVYYFCGGQDTFRGLDQLYLITGPIPALFCLFSNQIPDMTMTGRPTD